MFFFYSKINPILYELHYGIVSVVIFNFHNDVISSFHKWLHVEHVSPKCALYYISMNIIILHYITFTLQSPP